MAPASGFKPGDWICPGCGDHVFASKSACKMCGTPRPEDGGDSSFAARPGPYAGFGGKGKEGKLGRPEAEPSDNLYVSGLPSDADRGELETVFSQYGEVRDVRITWQGQAADTSSALIRYSTVDEAVEVRDALNGNIPQGFEMRIQAPLKVKFHDGGKWKAQEQSAWGSDGGGAAGSSGTKGGDAWECAGGGGSKGGSKGSVSFSMKTVIAGFEEAGKLPGGRGWNDGDGSQVPLFVRGLARDTEDVDLYKLFGSFGAIGPRGVRVVRLPDGSCRGFGFVNFVERAAADAAIEVLDGTVMPDGDTTLQVQHKDAGRGDGGGFGGGGCSGSGCGCGFGGSWGPGKSGKGGAPEGFGWGGAGAPGKGKLALLKPSWQQEPSLLL